MKLKDCEAPKITNLNTIKVDCEHLIRKKPTNTKEMCLKYVIPSTIFIPTFIALIYMITNPPDSIYLRALIIPMIVLVVTSVFLPIFFGQPYCNKSKSHLKNLKSCPLYINGYCGQVEDDVRDELKRFIEGKE